MARAAITKNALVANSLLADPTADVIDQANGMVLAAGTEFDKVVFRVKITNAAGGTVTVGAGAGKAAFRAGLGAYTSAAFAQNDVNWLGPFEQARFSQTDGTMNVDFAANVTGEISAFVIPRHI